MQDHIIPQTKKDDDTQAVETAKPLFIISWPFSGHTKERSQAATKEPSMQTVKIQGHLVFRIVAIIDYY